MTSRVQKGGPIFRPVVKSRARPDVRQSSVAADASSSVNVNTSLNPPPSIQDPVKSPPPAPVNPAVAPISDSPSPPHSNPLSTPRQLPPINTLAAPHGLTRSIPIPPTLTSHSTFIPVVTRTAPSATKSQQSSDIQNSSHRGAAPAFVSLNGNPINHSGLEVIPASRSNAAAIKSPGTGSEEPSTIPTDRDLEINTRGAKIPIRMTRSTSASTGTTSLKAQARKKRKATTASDDEVSGEETPEPTVTKRKRRASSGTPRPRRSRGPSLPPYDPDADPGEDIDPTMVTMASLCSDTGQGRVSRKAAEILSNHAAWKTQSREKRARMKALMELKKYGREAEADALEADSNPISKTPVDSVSITSTTTNPTIVDDTGSGFDYSQDLATSRFNVQVRIGPNGETIIDEESLVVDRTEGEDTSNYTHVVESDHTKFVNSGSYGKRYRGSRWSAEETELFYDALAQYGENYELIAYVLPGRDRKSCKNKFKAEDKKNPARINHCLNNKIPVDMVTLSRMTGKDFSGPVPEIQFPTPRPIIEPTESNTEPSAPTEPTRKKAKKKTLDDGVMIVGDTDSFVPFPSSP
ncbi:hypothetical protein H0H81_007444 [Sphagnurus paluster]|uniref:Myb-like domain-containing protein n=1 Tax=Sphagnurus paluster TaxID=117069 RepID=A0A9P7KLI0_9AGAR|nr:hypothetical protein H0H81_007444 [Sphagnurus paluster]